MGGKQPAMNYILACLDAGKNVVTANKDLVASEGKKILATAKRNGKDFLYEASVAGGIPIIRPVKQCLAANHITELMGIFNGTTNFILTKMSQEGMEFGDALRLAQDMGYAEADPTADVEGLDAGRKVAILASAAKALPKSRRPISSTQKRWDARSSCSAWQKIPRKESKPAFIRC